MRARFVELTFSAESGTLVHTRLIGRLDEGSLRGVIYLISAPVGQEKRGKLNIHPGLQFVQRR